MSLLEETILRGRLREVLQQCGIGRLLKVPHSPSGYHLRGVYCTKLTEGITAQGRELLRKYKNANKEAYKWRQQQPRAWKYFYTTYESPNKKSPGYLYAVYQSTESQLDDTEF